MLLELINHGTEALAEAFGAISSFYGAGYFDQTQ
jgi:hypothetical protein